VGDESSRTSSYAVRTASLSIVVLDIIDWLSLSNRRQIGLVRNEIDKHSPNGSYRTSVGPTLCYYNINTEQCIGLLRSYHWQRCAVGNGPDVGAWRTTGCSHNWLSSLLVTHAFLPEVFRLRQTMLVARARLWSLWVAHQAERSSAEQWAELGESVGLYNTHCVAACCWRLFRAPSWRSVLNYETPYASKLSR